MTAKRCLLVEQSAAQAMAIMRMINGNGWTVFAADSLRTALHTLATEPIDLALTELVLSDSPGPETVSYLMEQSPGCMVVAMTAGDVEAAAHELLAIARTQGATFLLRKPFAAERLLDILAEAARRIDGAPRREHVLVVDGSDAVRTVCIRTLQAAGFRATGAETLEEGLEFVDPQDLDALVLDMRAPAAKVIDALPELKDVLPGIGFVLTRGASFGADRDLRLALSAGADVALAKPYQPQELVSAVRKGIVMAKAALARRPGL